MILPAAQLASDWCCSESHNLSLDRNYFSSFFFFCCEIIWHNFCVRFRLTLTGNFANENLLVTEFFLFCSTWIANRGKVFLTFVGGIFTIMVQAINFLFLRVVKTFRSSFKIIHFIFSPTAGRFRLRIHARWRLQKLFHAWNTQSFYEVTKTLVQTHKTCFLVLLKGFREHSQPSFFDLLHFIRASSTYPFPRDVWEDKGCKTDCLLIQLTEYQEQLLSHPLEILSRLKTILKNFLMQSFKVLGKKMFL